MTGITAHVMVRNEEYWIGHVLTPLLQVLDHVIVIDTGSEDSTVEVVRDAVSGFMAKATILMYAKMDPKTNGQVRQWMTDMTKTEWAMIVDGDEYYPVEVLEKIKNTPPPAAGRLGFTTLQVVQAKSDGLYMAELWSKQAMFHVPTTKWSGAYPFENPNWVADPKSFFYYTDVVGLDLHHLKRSSKDAVTPHRNDHIRPKMPVTDLMTLPVDLSRWPNPYVTK